MDDECWTFHLGWCPILKRKKSRGWCMLVCKIITSCWLQSFVFFYNWGFPQMGHPKLPGWFISWKIQKLNG